MSTAFSRRAFLGWLAGVVPVAVVVRRAHAAAVLHLAADPRTLTALGQTVLPASLGAAGVRRATEEFRRWMAEYREGADVNHAYLTSRLRTTGPTPATRWTRQLEDLDARALAAHQRRFHELAAAERETVVREALRGERLERMPAIADANHVAVGLLAHFFDSSVANDLCYEAQIGRDTCRPLAAASRQPLPLARRG
jgi:gluconate 2-dehydrogenase subunit 3-like protein